MANIDVDVNPHLKLTTYTVSDSLDKVDVENVIKSFYSHEPTPYVIWDVSGCSQIDLSVMDLEDLSKLIAKTSIDRPEGKTAFVISEVNIDKGIIYENLAKMENLPYEYRSFKTKNEALTWLGLQH